MTPFDLARLDRFARFGIFLVPLAASLLPIESLTNVTGIELELALGLADILDGLAIAARASLDATGFLPVRIGISSLAEEIAIG